MKGKFIGRGEVCWLNQKRREEWALEIYMALIYGDYFNNKSLWCISALKLNIFHDVPS